MEYLIIYLLQIIDPVTRFLVMITLFSTFAYVITECSKMADENGDCCVHDVLQMIKKPVALMFTVLFLYLLIPTKQTLLLMGGVYYGKKVVTSEIGQKAYKIIDLQLDKYIKELTNENND